MTGGRTLTASPPSAPRSPRRRPGGGRIRPELVAVAVLVVLALVAGGSYLALQRLRDDPATVRDDPRNTGIEGVSTSGQKDRPPTRTSIGKAARDGDVAFKVTTVRAGYRTLGTGDRKVRASGRYVLVRMVVKNVGDRPTTLLPTVQRLESVSGQIYAADSSAPLALSARLWKPIAAGRAMTAVMVFDAPTQMRPASLELHGSGTSPGLTVQL